MSDHLFRDKAPITEAAWGVIDEEASRTLRHYLAGRPLVDFDGPKGWRHTAEPVGRVENVAAGTTSGVEARLRRAQPLVELRTPFALDRADLDSVDRGACDPDLDALIDAARRAAEAEDTAVFYGYAAAGIRGIGEASPHQAVEISDDYNEYPRSVAQAVAVMRRSGVGGPYGIALGPRCYTGVIESTEHGGYPVLEHIRMILGGPVIWAPAVAGAVVVSLRGGDYILSAGQDFSIGYLNHTDAAVNLYFEETFTFRIVDERAAVELRYPDSGRASSQTRPGRAPSAKATQSSARPQRGR
jgi:uncharacterized linocin/CFP29 family protein